jgi:hypothetical protein
MSSEPRRRSESERRRDPEVLRRLWERQVVRYGPELAQFDGGWGPGADGEVPAVTDEQLEAARAQIEAAFGPGVAQTFLSSWNAPLSDADRAALAEFPDVIPGATADDFAAAHDMMRRRVGDLRAAPASRQEAPGDEPARSERDAET